jgi:dimethylaniline monooxygenase (N-oxide forming)
VASYPTGAQVYNYHTSYAQHFDLEPHVQLNASIQHITFDDEQQKSTIKFDGQTANFDKIVISNGGSVGLPNIPSIEGLEKFKGCSIHSQAFKKSRDFAGKRVMVVGFGNSAADTATQLAGVADKVYIAHKHGARILPCGIDGQPVDHAQSIRLFKIETVVLK